MDYTLNLFDHLLERGRRFQQLGRPAEAMQALSHLTSFRELPTDVSEEAQVRLAQLHLKRRRYGRARRALAAALRLQPNSARYHFLMASAYRADERCDLDRAAHHYERALELEPNQVRCLCDYGLLALKQGQTEKGIERLQRAAELSPDTPDVIGKLVSGLCQVGRCDEARSALRAAMFRNPRSPRFRKMWADFQLLQLRREQEVAALDHADVDEGPVLLPFQQPGEEALPAPVEEELTGRTVRLDGPADHLPAPHGPRLLRRSVNRRVR